MTSFQKSCLLADILGCSLPIRSISMVQLVKRKDCICESVNTTGPWVPFWEGSWQSRLEGGGAGCHMHPESRFLVWIPLKQPYHLSGTSEIVRDPSGRDKAQTFSSADNRQSYYRTTKQNNNKLSPRHLVEAECAAHYKRRLINAVLPTLSRHYYLLR